MGVPVGISPSGLQEGSEDALRDVPRSLQTLGPFDKRGPSTTLSSICRNPVRETDRFQLSPWVPSALGVTAPLGSDRGSFHVDCLSSTGFIFSLRCVSPHLPSTYTSGPTGQKVQIESRPCLGTYQSKVKVVQKGQETRSLLGRSFALIVIKSKNVG